MDLLACSPEYCLHLVRSLARSLLCPTSLSLSLAFPVLVRQQAAAAQHSVVHYLLVAAAPKTSQIWTETHFPETSFIWDPLTRRHLQMEYNSGWLHTLPTLIPLVVGSNYWNHVWCFKLVSDSAGGQVRVTKEETWCHGGTQVSGQVGGGGGESD